MQQITQGASAPIHKKRKYTGFIFIVVFIIGSLILAFTITAKNISIKKLLGGNLSTKEVLSSNDEKGDGNNEEASSVFKSKLTPIYSEPTKLIINSINLKADVVPVGVLGDGSMETPKDWFIAGWYEKGGRPGEKKNLIINGHYDTNTGSAAVFWNINKIKVNDFIEVIDKYGRIFTYKVVELKYVDLQDPSRLDVLKNEEDKSTLTLITCQGIWIQGYGYNKRLIVKADIVD